MRSARSFCLAALAVAALLALSGTAAARNPRNPYSSFNLSGINYGSMQWEKAQRQGKRVWPYYNTPARSYARGSAVSVGGVGGYGGGIRTAPRRWRR
ncbi:MAG: hypothetical protein ACKO4Z_08610 [Planctomycetota bacterium]